MTVEVGGDRGGQVVVEAAALQAAEAVGVLGVGVVPDRMAKIVPSERLRRAR